MTGVQTCALPIYEDSLSDRFSRDRTAKLIDIAVLRLPRISNFTDLGPFERYENVSVRYVSSVRELGAPDCIVLPGTKSTIGDLLWLRQSGLEAAVKQAASRGTLLVGICGGYQMLGREIADPEGAEAAPGTRVVGMGLLELETVFREEKVQTQTRGAFGPLEGLLAPLSGMAYEGYEIHMGRSGEDRPPLAGGGNVYGTYIHGVFDAPGVADAVLAALCGRKGVDPSRLGSFDAEAYREGQYDLLADAVRENLDMEMVCRILNRQN